ncbi:MAG: adenylate/guanylate cyclase domain-containing protein [Microthrixaceae bacterium]
MDTSATAAVLFCDVVGSTARQSRVGDRGADELRHRLFPLLQGCVAAGGGRVVKTLGDGLMAVFERSTIGALECAVRMHAVASEFDPDDPLELRVGISIGEVLEEDGDWFGTPVVEAARLCDAAGDGRTLAHSVVASLVGSRGQHFTFSDVGERTLKGLPDALPVIEVTGGTDAAGVQLGAPSPSGRQTPARGAESSTSMRPVVGAGVVLVLVGAVAAVWAFGGSSDGSEGALDGAASTGEASGGDPAVLDYTPVASEQECPDGLTVNLPDVRCGAIEVPENRNDDDSRTISVHYAMTPALGTPSADPVVLMGFNEHLDRTALREVADVYALSIRGFDSRHRDEFRCPALASAQVAQFAARQDDPEHSRPCRQRPQSAPRTFAQRASTPRDTTGVRWPSTSGTWRSRRTSTASTSRPRATWPCPRSSSLGPAPVVSTPSCSRTRWHRASRHIRRHRARLPSSSTTSTPCAPRMRSAEAPSETSGRCSTSAPRSWRRRRSRCRRGRWTVRVRSRCCSTS